MLAVDCLAGLKIQNVSKLYVNACGGLSGQAENSKWNQGSGLGIPSFGFNNRPERLLASSVCGKLRSNSWVPVKAFPVD